MQTANKRPKCIEGVLSKKFYLFNTRIGYCGLCWKRDQIIAFYLPESNPRVLAAKIAMKVQGAIEAEPTNTVLRATNIINQYLNGHKPNFDSLNLTVELATSFENSVYIELRKIPFGKLSTYSLIAQKIGRPKATRAVGTALSKNPFPIILPCHRVLSSNEKLSGYSAPGGLTMKLAFLQFENIYLKRYQSWNLFTAAETLSHRDKALSKIINSVGLPKIDFLGQSSLLTYLVSLIVAQQLNTQVAKVILSRLFSRFAKNGKLNDSNLYLAKNSDLRKCGLSQRKIITIKEISKLHLENCLPSKRAMLKMSDSEIYSVFSSVKGIGRWTVDMLLMNFLGRPDILASSDLGVRKGFALLKKSSSNNAANQSQLENYASRWSPFRSAACWYLWRSLEL